MDDKLMSQFVDLVKSSVTQTITELNNKSGEYEGQISELNGQLTAKDAKIAELNAALEAANATIAEKEQAITAQTTELNSLKDANAALEKDKKLAELNSVLAGFTAEEQALAQAEIDAFKADPTSVELVRKSKETHTNEQNSAGSAPDIFGGVADPQSDGDADIYG